MMQKNVRSLIINDYLRYHDRCMFENGHDVRKRTPPSTVSRGKQMDDVTNRQDL